MTEGRVRQAFLGAQTLEGRWLAEALDFPCGRIAGEGVTRGARGSGRLHGGPRSVGGDAANRDWRGCVVAIDGQKIANQFD